MTDIALAWNADDFVADLALERGQLVTDEGLRTAVLISLFTDARAPAGSALPEDGADPRGWWGDAFPALPAGSTPRDDDALGSTLWLLQRAKAVPATVEAARQAAYDALAWLIRDGVASAIAVSAEARVAGAIGSGPAATMLALSVSVDRPAGPGRQRFDFVWNASTGELL